MNTLFSSFFESQEICPEPRTDVVPHICIISLLAILTGTVWFIAMDKITDTTEHKSVVDLDSEESASEDEGSSELEEPQDLDD